MIGRIGATYRAAFSGLPREVWLLATAMLINRAGAMVLPFLALFVRESRGMPASAVGAVMLAWGLGSIAGATLGGKLCGRMAPLTVQRAALGLSGCTFLLIPLTPAHVVPMAVAAFVASMSADMFRPAIMVSVADAAPEAVRTRSMALIRLAANLGFATGPTIGGVLASFDYIWIFVGDALTSWAACWFLWRWVRFPETAGPHGPEAPGAAARRAAHHDLPFLGLLALMMVLTLALFQTFSTLPLFLRQDYGLPERTIGMLLGMNGLIIALFEMVLLRRIEHLPQLRVMSLGTFVLCAGLALFPFGRGVAYAAVAMAVCTLGEMLSLPLSTSLVALRAPAGARGAYMGLYSAAFSVAFIVAPVVGIFVLENFGGRTLWLGVGALGPVLAIACRALERVFVPLGETSHAGV